MTFYPDRRSKGRSGFLGAAMKKETRNALLKYGVTVLAGLVITIPAAMARGFVWGGNAGLNVRYLSDGFFVAAVMLIGVGALTWVSSTGFFDMFSYAFKSLLLLFSSLKGPKEHPTYFDFKTARAEKRAKAQFFILFVGLGYLAASLICLAVYYGG